MERERRRALAAFCALFGELGGRSSYTRYTPRSVPVTTREPASTLLGARALRRVECQLLKGTQTCTVDIQMSIATKAVLLTALLLVAVTFAVDGLAEFWAEPPSDLELVDPDSFAAAAPRDRWLETAEFLTPERADVVPSSFRSDDEEPLPPQPEPTRSPGGPLADDGWIYQWAAVDRRDPGATKVLLRRTSDGRQRTHRRVDSASSKRTEISFFVRELRIVREEHALDFVAVTADSSSFVYFLPDDPSRHYVLKRRKSSIYGTLGGDS